MIASRCELQVTRGADVDEDQNRSGRPERPRRVEQPHSQSAATIGEDLHATSARRRQDSCVGWSDGARDLDGLGRVAHHRVLALCLAARRPDQTHEQCDGTMHDALPEQLRRQSLAAEVSIGCARSSSFQRDAESYAVTLAWWGEGSPGNRVAGRSPNRRSKQFRATFEPALVFAYATLIHVRMDASVQDPAPCLRCRRL